MSQQRYDSKIIFESKDKIWDIDWTQIWYELKYWEPPWQCMSFKEFLKLFIIALIMFCVSNYDVYTDGQLTYLYFSGDMYEFRFWNDTNGTICPPQQMVQSIK